MDLPKTSLVIAWITGIPSNAIVKKGNMKSTNASFIKTLNSHFDGCFGEFNLSIIQMPTAVIPHKLLIPRTMAVGILTPGIFTIIGVPSMKIANIVARVIASPPQVITKNQQSISS